MGHRQRDGLVRALLLAGCWCLLPWSAAAQVPAHQEMPPETINYQGTLRMPDGTAMPGPVNLVIVLYTQAEGGPSVWSQTYAQTPLFEGVFDVVLGNTPGFSQIIAEHDSLWVGVSVNGGQEHSPRQRLSAVPFAFSAAVSVDTLHGLPAGTVLPFGGPLEQIPYGWLPCAGQAVSADAHPEYAALWAAIGTTWGGTGAADFRLPNFGGRTLIGAGAGPDLSARTVGNLLGEESTTLDKTHMPPHLHSYTDKHSAGAVVHLGGWSWEVAEWQPTEHPYQTGSTGGSNNQTVPHNTMQPSAVVHFIIKY